MQKSKSVLKRQRQNETRRLRNKAVRSALRTQQRRVVSAASPEEAAAEFVKFQKTVDKAATKRVIHPNTASRMKSRLAKKIERAPAE